MCLSSVMLFTYEYDALCIVSVLFSFATRMLSLWLCTYLALCGGGRAHNVVIAGIAQPYSWDEGSSSSDREKKESGTSSHPTSVTHSPTPPPQRRLAKSFSVAPSAVTKGNYGFLLLASVQLCPCSAFCASFGHLCCIFKLHYLCTVPNCTVSFQCLILYKSNVYCFQASFLIHGNNQDVDCKFLMKLLSVQSMLYLTSPFKELA